MWTLADNLQQYARDTKKHTHVKHRKRNTESETMKVSKITGNKLNSHQYIWEASEVVDGQTLTIRNVVKSMAVDALRAKVKQHRNSATFEAAMSELENLTKKSAD